MKGIQDKLKRFISAALTFSLLLSIFSNSKIEAITKQNLANISNNSISDVLPQGNSDGETAQSTDNKGISVTPSDENSDNNFHKMLTADVSNETNNAGQVTADNTKYDKLPETSDSFDVTLAGTLINRSDTLNESKVSEIIKGVPNNGGIWIPESERNYILNFVNSSSMYPFCVDKYGYLIQDESAVSDSSKSRTFYEKLLSLVSGKERVILTDSTFFWNYDSSSHKIYKESLLSEGLTVKFANSRVVILNSSFYAKYKNTDSLTKGAVSLLSQLLKNGDSFADTIYEEMKNSDESTAKPGNSLNSSSSSSNSGNPNSISSKDGAINNAESSSSTGSTTSESQITAKTSPTSGSPGSETVNSETNENPAKTSMTDTYNGSVSAAQSSSSLISGQQEAQGNSVKPGNADTNQNSVPANENSSSEKDTKKIELPATNTDSLPPADQNAGPQKSATQADDRKNVPDTYNDDGYSNFCLTLDGLLNNKKVSVKDAKEILNSVPSGGGIWVPKDEQNGILTIINSISSKKFEFNSKGFLVLSSGSEDDSSKSAKFAEKLLSLINGKEKIILSSTSFLWYYDTESNKIIKRGIGNSHSIQFQNGNNRLVLLSDSIFNNSKYDPSELGVILLNQLLLDGTVFENTSGNSSGIKLMSLAPSNSILWSCDGTMLSDQSTYAGPGSSIYASVGSVNNGESVRVICLEQNWAYIEYAVDSSGEHKRGYVPRETVGVTTGGLGTVDYHNGYFSSPNSDLSVYYLDSASGLGIGTVYAGEGVTVLKNYGDVCYIEYSSASKTKRGYVRTSNLCGSRGGVIGIVTVGNSPVYSGTDTHFFRAGSVDGTEYVVILRWDSGWAFIEYNTPSGRKRGYAATSNITDHNPTSSLPSIPTGRSLGTADTDMGVYYGPNQNYPTIGSIYSADQINVLIPNENGFAYVEYYTGNSQSKRGYIDPRLYHAISLSSLPTPSGGTKVTYGTSGMGRNLDAYKIGSGPNVLFAVCEQHGFEDAWAADGVELVNIGNNLVNSLQSSSYLSKWTIYVIPSANPDGLLNGYTNNGPGRCTCYGGYDMNRSHSTSPFTTYTDYYDPRNYTGYSPALAAEVSSLESFVKSKKSSSGQNVLLDIHGWEDKTIGDPTISTFFDNALGLSHVSNAGDNGYLITWGMQNGIDSTLVELPLCKNPADVAGRNLSGKINSAVNNLIANTGTAVSSEQAPTGWLDVVDSSTISGWAMDSNNPSVSIYVDIYVRKNSDNSVVKYQRVLANNYRSDVTPGSHGFSYAVDWRDVPPGDYNVCVYGMGGSNPQLYGCPKSYSVRSSTGFVDYVNTSGVGGWVWKPDAPNKPIQAHVYIYDSNGKYLLGLPLDANKYRSDLNQLGYGNGNHGFSTSIDWIDLPKEVLTIKVYAVDNSGNSPLIYNSVYDNTATVQKVISPIWKKSDENYSPAVQSMLLELNFEWYFADSIDEQQTIVKRAEEIRKDVSSGAAWWLDQSNKVTAAAAKEFSWFLGGGVSNQERDQWLEMNQCFQADLSIHDNQTLANAMFIAGLLMPTGDEASIFKIGVRSWIKHETYNEVRNKLGKDGIEKFIHAMQKGFVSSSGEIGIKSLGSGEWAGNKLYKYEIKILGKGTSHYRILGNYDAKTKHIIFEKLINK